MYAIIGALGKVGFATSQALRRAGVPVRAIVRDATKAERLREIGCEIAVADLRDTAALVKAISDVETVQIILPTSPEMQSATESLANALEQAQPKRILAISDYGAHVAHDIGMPTVFRCYEERLSRLPGHKIFLRSAPHMENWSRVAPVAIASGTLPSFQDPVDQPLPTISAYDLGKIAANLLLRPVASNNVEIAHAEGPRRYSANAVAAALSELLGKPIIAAAVPRSQWDDAFARVVGSGLATILIKTNDAQNEGLVDVEQDAGEVCYGTTELIDALRPLVT